MIQNVQGKSKSRAISQMVWGCFISDKLGLIIFIESTVKQDVYIMVLSQFLLPFVSALTEDGHTNLSFQQDNAMPHCHENE